MRQALAAEPHENVSCRSYRECEELCQVKLVAHLTFRELKEGNFLLHSEAAGTSLRGIDFDQWFRSVRRA